MTRDDRPAPRAARPARDRAAGFSLIELLVVVVVLGLLAGIAIPVFLKQRARGYLAALESDLRNAATSNEGWASDHEGSYVPPGPDSLPTLVGEGFHPSTGVRLTVVDDHMAGVGGGFCLRAVHDRLGPAYARYFASGGPTAGEPTAAPCTPS